MGWKIFICKKCHHEWPSLKVNPKCPKCKTRALGIPDLRYKYPWRFLECGETATVAIQAIKTTKWNDPAENDQREALRILNAFKAWQKRSGRRHDWHIKNGCFIVKRIQ